MNNKIILWLDDYRDPKTSDFLPKFIPNFKNYDDIFWVKNYDGFCEWITNNGIPINIDLLKISFDHDLADEHYAPENRYDDYNTWANEQNFQEKTGMDCAKWLVDYCLDNNKLLPTWMVHSANPSGAENITKLLLNFMKHQNKKFK
tara:strand:+ start:24401 stop:24838 length:438 start_codon:yes stop_codon:yes gene_type:complete